MATKIQGIKANEIVPSHKVTLSRDETGNWTGSETFSCRYVDYGNEATSSKLQRGTPITDLDPHIPIKYSFIKLESHRISHQKGGITQIACEFSGFSEDDGFTTDREKTYSYRATIGKESILNHPLYKAEVTAKSVRAAIAAYYDGSGQPEEGTGGSYFITSKNSFKSYTTTAITGPDEIKWLEKIMDGTRDYDNPMIEWTVSEANAGGMSQDDLDGFGRWIADPPGNPAVPSWADKQSWWMFSDLSEDKSSGSSSYSRTYTLRTDELDGDLYAYTLPTPTP